MDYATDKLFAKEGATVYAMARRLHKLENLENETKDLPDKVIAVQGDVTKQEDVDNAVKTVLDGSGRIDVLINNAGIMDDFYTVVNVSDELYDKVMEINVMGVMQTMRAVIPHMIEAGKGSIINTASVGGLFGGRGGFTYVASKHVVVGMTKNVAVTYMDKGIRCNAILPGSVSTELGEKIGDVDKKGAEITMKINSVMEGKIGKADELAAAFLFLASDDSSFVNGASIVVDGGWTAF